MSDGDPINRARRTLLTATVALAAITSPVRAEEGRMKPPSGLKKRPREKFKYRDSPVDGRSCAKCLLYFGDGQCAIIEGGSESRRLVQSVGAADSRLAVLFSTEGGWVRAAQRLEPMSRPRNHWLFTQHKTAFACSLKSSLSGCFVPALTPL